MDQWYVVRGKVQKGPYSLAQLRQAASHGSLRVTDMLLQDGVQTSLAAGEMPGLFPAAAVPAQAAPRTVPPTRPPVPTPVPSTEPVPSGPATPDGSAPAGRRASRVPWRWVALGALGLGTILLVSLRFVGGSSDRLKTKLAAPQDASPPSVRVETQDPAVPKKKTQDDLPKAKVATAKKGGKPGAFPKAKVATTKKGEPRPREVVPDIELPPAGPTIPLASDPVVKEYKAARAVYGAALKKAREELGDQVSRARAAVEKSDLDAGEKAKSIKDFDNEAKSFATSRNNREGPIPSHAAMRSFVAEYVRAVESATHEFGQVAEKGLAAYQKMGVIDLARLKPLLAAQLAGKHANLIGIWEGKAARSTRSQIWLVDVDENSGGWRIGALEELPGFPPKDACRAEGTEFKDGVLAFVAAPVDMSTRKARSGGKPTTLTFQDGTLRCETRDGAKSVVLDLRRTDDEGQRTFFDRFVSKAAAGGASGGLDLTNADNVWRRVAQLATFAYTRSGDPTPLTQEMLYMPYRSTHMTVPKGQFAGLTGMMTGRAWGSAENEKRAEALLLEYERLAAAAHPYLQRIVGLSDAICRYRIRLGLADEKFGNTPASSMRNFQQEIFKPAIQYSFMRDDDEQRLRRSVERQYPGYRVTVYNAPLSADSQAKLAEMLSGAGNFMENVKNRGAVSGQLYYADMAAVDRAADFWRDWLLPLARRSGGPASATPLTAVEGSWAPAPGNGDHQSLDDFLLRNVSGNGLTHGVVELITENEWGNKAAQYYYFDRLNVSEILRLEPSLRWQKRRLPFTNTVKVTWSLWADQGSEVGRNLTLTNPRPNRETAAFRKDFLRNDRETQAKGEALGELMQNMVPLPSIPGRPRRLIARASAPQSSYIFRLPGESGRTLVLRFLRFNLDGNAFEAEIFDPGSRQPFDPQTPVWKGTFDPRSNDIRFARNAAGTDGSWAFALARDEQPEIVCPGAGKPGAPFPAEEIPLFAVKSP